MPLSTNAAAIYGILSVSGIKTASAIGHSLRLSQPTISRALGELRATRPEAFVSFATKGKTVLYGLRKSIHGLPLSVPVYICEESTPAQIGSLSALCAGGFLFEGGPGARYFEGLPWFLRDMVPQGYMGRAFCRAWAEPLGIAGKPQEWSDEDAFFILASRGGDAPGNLIIGRANMDGSGNPKGVATATLASESSLPAIFDEMARNSVAGEPSGSSAAGEFPKFVTSYQVGELVRNVIVKFSPDGADAVATRWRDMLVAEHAALEVLASNEVRRIASATSRLVRGLNRIYLEVDRFDRTGEGGRIGVVTMGTIDDEFIGRRASWSATASSLVVQGMLDDRGAEEIRFLESFGHYIGNTDMHHGNISFYCPDNPGTTVKPILELAPVYDMLPMLYAPERGEIVTRSLALPQDTDREAATVALQYWDSVAGRKDISEGFRAIAHANASMVSDTLRRQRPLRPF